MNPRREHTLLQAGLTCLLAITAPRANAAVLQQGDGIDRITKDPYTLSIRHEGLWMDYERGEFFEGPTTLKNRPIPIDSMPLFIGRTAFIIHEENGGTLKATFYPQVANGDDYHFVDRNPGIRSKVSIGVRQTAPANVRVLKEDGALVPTGPVHDGRGISFVFEPGVNYRITAVENP